MDMTEGIIARFRTMAIARASVLTGHVVGSVIQTMLALAIVMVVAVLIGFRSDDRSGSSGSPRPASSRSPRSRSPGCRSRSGMVTEDVETASNLPMFLVLLPFLSSGFVPTESMPGRPQLVRREPAVHADHRDRPRACCSGPRSATTASLAVAWCVGISVGGYLWARKLYDRDPASSE